MSALTKSASTKFVLLASLLVAMWAHDVRADKKESALQLSEGQHQALAELDKHFAAARIARMQGQVDVPAMRAPRARAVLALRESAP